MSDKEHATKATETAVRRPSKWIRQARSKHVVQAVAIVPGQLLALHLTLTKGHDPDQPQGIQKVTLTR